MCSEDNVDVHDIELMQYISVDCSKLKRLLQGLFPVHLQNPQSLKKPTWVLVFSAIQYNVIAARHLNGKVLGYHYLVLHYLLSVLCERTHTWRVCAIICSVCFSYRNCTEI